MLQGPDDSVNPFREASWDKYLAEALGVRGRSGSEKST